MKIDGITYYSSEAMGDWSAIKIQRQFVKESIISTITDERSIKIGTIPIIENMLNPLGVSMEFAFVYNKKINGRLLDVNSMGGVPTIGYSLIYKDKRLIALPIIKKIPERKKIFDADTTATAFLCGDLCTDMPERYEDDNFMFRANTIGGFVRHINIFLRHIEEGVIILKH